jgi:3-deoxy-manno-octulosonate cytidylyltransferase (CMP-KDO synthetase)
MMKAVGVIPARWASTRLPGKVLIDICGKPMVQHVWERAKACRSLSDVIIACDEPQVLEHCRSFGAKTILTDKNHASGSDRVAEAIRDVETDVVVNIQADEPLIDPKLIDALVDALAVDKDSVVATPIKRINNEAEYQDPNVVKVVADKDGHALYFSRAPIPLKRDDKAVDLSRYFKHLGIYAFRRDFLFVFCRLPKSFLEQEEKLEQLRILEAGFKIKCVVTTSDSIAVDTQADVVRVVDFLKGKNKS